MEVPEEDLVRLDRHCAHQGIKRDLFIKTLIRNALRDASKEAFRADFQRNLD